MCDDFATDDLARIAPAAALATVIAFPSTTEQAALVPEPLSSFIGRQQDVAQVAALLADPAVRLLTLTGPGGIGKTRLAMAAAAAGQEAFPDGVVFVALESVRQAEEVIPAIAQALGLRERSDQDQKAQLRAALDRKQLLLVLDNFEQVLAAGPEVTALLVAARRVTALVTSRAPLRVDGERALLIPPLTLAGERATVAELLASDAGRLFIERARLRDPALTLDDQSAPVIADICTRLEGLPLAIELAAARANVLPPRQLHARLEHRLPFLTQGARNAPPRHGAMRNAIAWSYDLLSPDEQRTFRQLAVFVDGCTLAAAEDVGGEGGRFAPGGGGFAALGGGPAGLEVEERSSADFSPLIPRERSDPPRPSGPPPFVLEAISALVDQCLLTRERGLDGEPRFRMLETIREFGLEQLAAAGEEDEARTRHARHFLTMARALLPLASVHARQAPLDQLLAEHANLQEALRWLEARGAAEFAELAAALGLSWYSYGSYREGQSWLERAISMGNDAPAPVRGRLLYGYAAVLFAQGDISKATSYLEQGVSLLRAEGDPLDLALALTLRGAVMNSEGDYEAAETPLGEALALADQLADPVLRAAVAGRALANLAGAALGQRDFARATAYGEEALRIYEGWHLDLAESLLLMDLGAIAQHAGDDELAAERWREGIGLMGERGDKRAIAGALSGIARVAATGDQQPAALLLFGAADALREQVGAGMFWPFEALATERSLATLRHELGEETVAARLAESRTLSLAEAVAVASAVVQPVPDAASAGDMLTRRESEVLRLLGEQRTDQEIADALFLSRRTVSWHVRSILTKLKATSRGEAVSRALERGLI